MDKIKLFRLPDENSAYPGMLEEDSNGKFITFSPDSIPFNWNITGRFLQCEDDVFLIKRLTPKNIDGKTVMLKAYY